MPFLLVPIETQPHGFSWNIVNTYKNFAKIIFNFCQGKESQSVFAKTSHEHPKSKKVIKSSILKI